jgi:predicted RNA-binding protein YlxR (DUF448 family)
MKASKPARTCLGCGKRKEKSEMIRLGFMDGIIKVDDKRVLLGRGCYVCHDAGCLNDLLKGKRIFNALRINHDAGLIKRLADELKGKILLRGVLNE